MGWKRIRAATELFAARIPSMSIGSLPNALPDNLGGAFQDWCPQFFRRFSSLVMQGDCWIHHTLPPLLACFEKL